MKSISLLALLLSVNCFAQAPAAAPNPEIQSYLDSLAADGKLPGAILVAKDGVPIASITAGLANKATNAAIRLNTKSISAR